MFVDFIVVVMSFGEIINRGVQFLRQIFIKGVEFSGGAFAKFFAPIFELNFFIAPNIARH